MKIKKNLSDADMMANYTEETTFENALQEDEPAPKKTAGKNAGQSTASQFFTPDLEEKIGKALLELKVKLFNSGIVDYDLKVSVEDNKIILTPAPAKKHKK